MDVHKVTTTFMDKLEVILIIVYMDMPGYQPGNRMKTGSLKLLLSLAFLSRILSSIKHQARILNVKAISI